MTAHTNETEKKETYATKLGYQAFCDGKEFKPPYPLGSDQYEQWSDGYIEAEHDFS